MDEETDRLKTETWAHRQTDGKWDRWTDRKTDAYLWTNIQMD